jgi:hypothetical protein
MYCSTYIHTYIHTASLVTETLRMYVYWLNDANADNVTCCYMVVVVVIVGSMRCAWFVCPCCCYCTYLHLCTLTYTHLLSWSIVAVAVVVVVVVVVVQHNTCVHLYSLACLLACLLVGWLTVVHQLPS